MRFSSAIVITLVAALASSSISAMPAEAPDTAVADKCPWFCKEDTDCGGCMAVRYCLPGESYTICLQISIMTVGTDAQFVSNL
ncbi:hypothetical protein DFJ58DRAFT_783829 [Suillus subalutaceus]|uniref:uncharacterized protein n=1 Tax=Suillus subalutaceus TaxID=48586 RepID=UPI001B876950|nr:uncharacterized protein DFJ58DRAFT_783829 [Suillus subalutaceus]KAG1856979.1 hypothetical protein DFJ58DRAFT_783829 [Suillus subalutaceus]